MLPARIPNLLINGATGIAVGMATNIPPHNLTEVCTALVKMIDADLEMSSAQLRRYIKAPDFPTGGQIINTSDELKEIYDTGSGTIRMRATWQKGPDSRAGQTIYITSVPYTQNKSVLVERIADVALSRKLPHLVDVRDLSTDDVRIALELKRDADPKMVMAYLYKHTPLQSTFPVNLTCLVPTENPAVSKPERLELHEILWHFLDFRFHVVTRRLEFELAALKRRIHILDGFETIFDALDEILKIVRKSEGKQDAAAEDHEAVLARRRADRRDPRAEDLPVGASRDPRDPAGARRQAETREGDRRAPQEQGQPLEDHPRRDRARAEERTATRGGPRLSVRWRSRSTPPTTSSSRKTTSSSSRATAG